MHPLAIYAMHKQRMAELMAEANANHLARRARPARKTGLVASVRGLVRGIGGHRPAGVGSAA